MLTRTYSLLRPVSVVYIFAKIELIVEAKITTEVGGLGMNSKKNSRKIEVRENKSKFAKKCKLAKIHRKIGSQMIKKNGFGVFQTKN